MKFQTVGELETPVIVMLSGSFCPSKGLKYVYEKLEDTYRIILPEYNGHYENSTFTTRQTEAAEVIEYLRKNQIDHIRMIYGQSMGAEVGIELFRQLQEKHIAVDHCFLDGAPCIKLPGFAKKVMYLKFKKMIDTVREKDIDQILNLKLLKKLANGDTESLRPMIEDFSITSKVLTAESIKNETECCYTFDFPAFDEASQKKMYFFYGDAEKAYKTCYAGVKKAYPMAEYKIVDGYGHLTYSMKNTDDYVKMVRSVCER